METVELIWEKICKNENGFPERKRCSVEVYAMEKSVTRAEAYESMRAGVNAVSYTHLDVYKRQLHIFLYAGIRDQL